MLKQEHNMIRFVLWHCNARGRELIRWGYQNENQLGGH